MVIGSQALTFAEIGRAELMLSNHDVDSTLLRKRDVEPAAEIAVDQQDITLSQAMVQPPQHAVFAGLFPFILAQGSFQDGSRRQRKQDHSASDRKTAARFLAGQLGILGLIGGG